MDGEIWVFFIAALTTALLRVKDFEMRRIDSHSLDLSVGKRNELPPGFLVSQIIAMHVERQGQ